MSCPVSSHLARRRLHGTNDLVVAGAAAKIAGEPIANLGFGRIGIAREQFARRNQDAWSADAALQAVELKEMALQRMQFIALGHALDGVDPGAVDFDAEHEA